KQHHATGYSPLTMRIDMQTSLYRHTGIEHRHSHEPSPQQRTPVVRPRHERRFVEKTVVASHQRIVHDDLHAGLRQPSELVEVSEHIEKTRTPSISTACCFCRFGQPDWLARCSPVAQISIEVERLFGAGKPFLRQSVIGRLPGCAAL